MGMMITYHGCNNPVYNAHKNVGAHYTRQNTVGASQVLTIVAFSGH